MVRSPDSKLDHTGYALGQVPKPFLPVAFHVWEIKMKMLKLTSCRFADLSDLISVKRTDWIQSRQMVNTVFAK